VRPRGLFALITGRDANGLRSPEQLVKDLGFERVDGRDPRLAQYGRRQAAYGRTPAAKIACGL
jgi:hypothetical protein